jgi:hypothetical protein
MSSFVSYYAYSAMGWEWINHAELKKAEEKKAEELKKEEVIARAVRFREELMKQIKLSKLKLKQIPKPPPIKQMTPVKFKGKKNQSKNSSGK